LAITPAPARAKTPCEAEKTSRDPVNPHPVAIGLAIGFTLASVDKRRVFGLPTNRGKFVKEPIDVIRRKYSIDGIISVRNASSPIRNHIAANIGNDTFTINVEYSHCGAANARCCALFGRCPPRLSVRLISL
jgi:hypothetical protein